MVNIRRKHRVSGTCNDPTSNALVVVLTLIVMLETSSVQLSTEPSIVKQAQQHNVVYTHQRRADAHSARIIAAHISMQEDNEKPYVVDEGALLLCMVVVREMYKRAVGRIGTCKVTFSSQAPAGY